MTKEPINDQSTLKYVRWNHISNFRLQTYLIKIQMIITSLDIQVGLIKTVFGRLEKVSKFKNEMIVISLTKLWSFKWIKESLLIWGNRRGRKILKLTIVPLKILWPYQNSLKNFLILKQGLIFDAIVGDFNFWNWLLYP